MEVAADLRPILGQSLVRLDPMRIKQLQLVFCVILQHYFNHSKYYIIKINLNK
uniref:Uncharacterized protein n=1 Tax=Heterorhabditis bacteriophora TaxID=37862 RepID=A0A1I7W984_HETBA